MPPPLFAIPITTCALNFTMKANPRWHKMYTFIGYILEVRTDSIETTSELN